MNREVVIRQTLVFRIEVDTASDHEAELEAAERVMNGEQYERIENMQVISCEMKPKKVNVR